MLRRGRKDKEEWTTDDRTLAKTGEGLLFAVGGPTYNCGKGADNDLLYSGHRQERNQDRLFGQPAEAS